MATHSTVFSKLARNREERQADGIKKGGGMPSFETYLPTRS